MVDLLEWLLEWLSANWYQIITVIFTAVMAFFTGLLWKIEGSRFKRIYEPELNIHSYPLEKSEINQGKIDEIENRDKMYKSYAPKYTCMHLRMALVNPGGVPITLMKDQICLTNIGSGEKIKAKSIFVPLKNDLKRVYVSQFPWVIKDFAIYEKKVFPEDKELREKFVDKDWKIKVKFDYEFKHDKPLDIETNLLWHAIQE